MTGEPTEEVRLPGAIGAVRVGETIRKPSGPWTPTVQALLRFLRERGFDLAPEPLGLDEQGREVQSVMPGAPAYRPWPPVMLRVDGVERLATVLRRYHDLVRAYDPDPSPAGEPAVVLSSRARSPAMATTERGTPCGRVIGSSASWTGT